MYKHRSKHKFVFNIIFSLIMCIMCSFSFFGCVGSMNFGGGTGSGGSSSSGSSGGNSSGGSSSGSGSGSDSGGTDFSGTYIEDYRDVLLCSIGVYEIDGNEEVFYDNYNKELMSFNDLLDRQFETIANYIYNTLNRIYGDSSTETSLSITNFGSAKTLSYSDIISDNKQKIISGISSEQLENSNYINYTNSINGGYEIVVNDNGDSTFDVTYNTSNVKSDNEWKGKLYFSKDYINNAIRNIYLNQQDVKSESDNIGFASDIDSSLRDYYSNSFNRATNSTTPADLSNMNSIGLSKKFVWNVAYYVAFSLIGETNIDNSINNYTSIFRDSQIETIDESNKDTLVPKLELYKGYNLILKDIFSSLINLNVPTTESLKISTSDSTSETTCFPSLKKEMYIKYDNYYDICDANNKEIYDENYTFDLEEDSVDVDVGNSFKLKKMLLIPYINVSKINISEFDFYGMFLGLQSVSAETYDLVMSVEGYDKQGQILESENLMVSDIADENNIKLTFDDSYDATEDLYDVYFNSSILLSSIVLKDLAEPVEFFDNNFHKTSRNVNYSAGDSRSIDIGYLKVYNNFVNSSGEFFNIESSFLEINFEYYNSNGNILTEIPECYMMYFMFY